MKISDIRRAIDSAQNARTDLQGHTTQEFIAADVSARLGRHIETLSALQIPARYVEELRQRSVAIDALARMLDRWQGLRAAEATKSAASKASPIQFLPFGSGPEARKLGFRFDREYFGTQADALKAFAGQDVLFVYGPELASKPDCFAFGVYRRQQTQRLKCTCCGASHFGRQWDNMDTGYGLCPACVDFCAARCEPEKMEQTYGVRGVHYDLPSLALV